MATSPNFNWPEPDNTDLVKNGALAIRTAVDAIDSSLVDLKGGTTGQVLSKASNTDMDFSWVAQDDSNAIQNAIVDAKGDLITATANDTPARLAVGATNNTVLTVDSSTATGLKYSADYTAYTPVWSANSGTAPSLGNGTLNGRYLLVGKLCQVQIFFQAGTTTTFGSGGIWQFTLPFNSNELSANTGGFSGSAYVEDAFIAGYQAVAIRKGGGANSCQIAMSSSSFLTSVVPFTWANQDYFNLSMVYGIA